MTPDNAMEYLDAGASHVIVTSYVFRQGRLEEERLQELVSWGVSGCEHVSHCWFISSGCRKVKKGEGLLGVRSSPSCFLC